MDLVHWTDNPILLNVTGYRLELKHSNIKEEITCPVCLFEFEQKDRV